MVQLAEKSSNLFFLFKYCIKAMFYTCREHLCKTVFFIVSFKQLGYNKGSVRDDAGGFIKAINLARVKKLNCIISQGVPVIYDY